ncbi:MAG: DinB family protein [Bacteroidetes bacterium]|nr:DinB family protein [Bacteroidota bacterium]
MKPLDICLLQWDAYQKYMEKELSTISPDHFNKPIVDGGNSPSWILGHLVDTDDALLPLLGIGQRLYPDLKSIYHHERGTNQQGHLSKEELTERWRKVSKALDSAFQSWTEADWLSKHTAVSEEDFAKAPQRNRLNVMLSRVSHKASHLGQIALAK